MPPNQADSLLDTLANDFGANYEFALGLFEEYRRDRAGVDASWREYFDRLLGVAPEPAPPVTVSAQPAAADSPAREGTLVRAVSGAPAPRQSKALTVPALLPGDIASPIRGGALRVAENMEASLAIPTATSMRGVPVRTLEENRKLLNKHREAAGAGKVSFTHLIAWAILRALDTFPRLNDAYAELEGQPHRIQRDSVRLGLAVDVQKKDGTRTLLVPNIKDAHKLAFPAFLQAYDTLVERARKGQVSPDDFMGTTVSLTNPGVVGTTASAPRLMPGQGLIIATGALDFPPEYRSMAPRTLSLLGISKVMTLTSTYDHRIIQGAESGLFLSRLEELLRGDDGFYERIFDELGVVHRPVHWEIDATPGLFGPAGSDEVIEKQASVLQLIHAYRVRGHLVADLDPLDSRRAPHQDLDPATYGLTLWDLDREFITDGLSGRDKATLREILEVLRETYCRTIGVEYMYIADPARKEWLQHRMEGTRNRPQLDTTGRRRILEKLVEAEAFERFLHAKYIGHKRFSLEGCETTIPLLDRILNDGAAGGVKEFVIGMAHRGRLNVLANTIGKPLAQIFSEFDGNPDPLATQGSGDVKYHLGASGVHEAPGGGRVTVSVSPNPSHLEWVNPVVEGMVRAKQEQAGDHARARTIPVLLHGDAAFAGQGVVAETLNLAQLEGYTTGGTIHVVINNQIGFTTSPEDARSSTYCTDVAKMVHAPVLHVNGDDPEAADHVAVVALEYRQKFKRDVVIDLVGYRRWGHNETDEPSYTQPLMYAKIKGHTPVAELYGEQLVRGGVITRAELDLLWAQKKAQMQEEGQGGFIPAIMRREPIEFPPVDPAAMWGRLRATLKALGTVPEGFEVHPKLLPFLKRRAELLEKGGEADWAAAEALAFGTLLLEGIPLRLSGQDSGRGTFSQRHAILYDVRTGKEHISLQALAPAGVRFEVYDSLLSEAAVMGFEFGYTVADHRTLCLWEAQFGDFENGAQVIVDQFLAASEQKWGQPTGLTLLLPHGYEGQGPEHSSARPERFLTLCAEDNMRVAYPSTPASYFHLLREQGRATDEKPLVVLTPKSLLRHPRCVSSLTELAEGRFHAVLDDGSLDRGRVRRVVLTSGKLYYELLKTREDRRQDGVALVRLEQFYPFPAEALGRLLERYPRSAELVWAQEEPSNMGAWRFVRERLLDDPIPTVAGRPLHYVGRPPSASPAAGSYKLHLEEQEAILREALAVSAAAAVPVAQPAPAAS
jgi:2-oxoglutarate dehydrogenase E1 component